MLVMQKTVAKIMNELGIAGLSPRAFVVKTTITQSQGVYPRDLVKRVFTPARANMIWTSDIERHEAFLDLAVVKGHRWMPVAAGV